MLLFFSKLPVSLQWYFRWLDSLKREIYIVTWMLIISKLPWNIFEFAKSFKRLLRFFSSPMRSSNAPIDVIMVSLKVKKKKTYFWKQAAFFIACKPKAKQQECFLYGICYLFRFQSFTSKYQMEFNMNILFSNSMQPKICIAKLLL